MYLVLVNNNPLSSYNDYNHAHKTAIHAKSVMGGSSLVVVRKIK